MTGDDAVHADSTLGINGGDIQISQFQNSDGKDIVSFTPSKKYQSIAFSSADIKKGSSYNVYYGGSSTGSFVDGLYQDGTYTPGTKTTTFTVSNVVTKLNIR